MSGVTVDHFLFLSAALFIIGMMGVLTRRNVLVIMMCVEMMIAAVSITLVAFSYETGTIHGQAFVLFALAIAAAESAVGLAIIISLTRRGKSLDVNEMRSLRD